MSQFNDLEFQTFIGFLVASLQRMTVSQREKFIPVARSVLDAWDEI